MESPQFKNNSDDDVSEYYEICQNCNRKFFQGRLQLHLKSCKPGKPQKQLKSTQNKFNINYITEKNLKNCQILQEKEENIEYPEVKQKLKQVEDNQYSVKQQQQIKKQQEFKQEQEEYMRQLQNEENFETKNYKIKNYSNDNNENYDDDQENNDKTRIECQFCGRKFDEDRIQKHESICCKQIKRKVFNSNQQRIIDGVDTKQISKQIKQEEKTTQQKKKWQKDHESFMEIIKYNKKLKEAEKKGESTSHLKPPEDHATDDYVFCQYCHRKFAPKTAERHIPICKDMINRPKPPKAINTKINTTVNLKNPQSPLPLEINEDQKKKYDIKKYVMANKEVKNQIEQINLQEYFNNKTPIKLQEQKVSFTDQRTKRQTSREQNPTEIKLKIHQTTNFQNLNDNNIYSRSGSYSNIVCQHCFRKFSSKAAERHIAVCEKIQNKAKPLNDQLRQINAITSRERQRQSSQGAQPLNNLNKIRYTAPEEKRKKLDFPNAVLDKKLQIQDKKGTKIQCFCTRCGGQYQSQIQRYCGDCGLKRQ